MNIFYDGQIYLLNPTGGISRYFTQLISNLPKHIIPSVTTCQSFKIHFPSHPHLKLFYKKFSFRPSRLAYWLEKYYFRSIATLNHFDVAHPTYYSLLSQQKINQYRCPVVLTVHDMIHELFPHQVDRKSEITEQKRKAIFAAESLICVSENTKKDLLERYPVLEPKISVIYHAASINLSQSYGGEPIPARPYYLYVGSRDRYKNFDGLLAAFAKAISVQPDIALCIVGSPLTETETKQITELNLTDRIQHYTHASDTHLAKLYRCSIALVYPSLYEGFGIPPLEAMSCGTPVIASNCASIPEVVGDAGLLFNPKSVSELTDRLLFLLDNPLERDRLITQGHQRAKAFSWDKTVAQTVEVYQSLQN
jgi:glycosyltransferase involved in cell wall biosynthesis